MKSHYPLIFLLVVGACAPAERPRTDIPVAAVDAAAPVATPPLVASDASATVFGGTVLAVGEAVAIDGIVAVGSGNPSSDAIEYRMSVPNKVVVVGRRAGDVSLRLVDGTNRAFRIIVEPCRAPPSHPAIILDVEEHADVDQKGVHQVEALLHSPWPANVHTREGGFGIAGQSVGRTTVMVTTDARTVELYDVFVGVCADRHYPAIAPAIPPGLVGPKGDGTCVRRHNRKETPAPCPEPSKLEALSDAALSPIACDWSASCGRMGDEGCCVGCKNPFRMKIGRICALRSFRAKTCAEALKILEAPTCAR